MSLLYGGIEDYAGDKKLGFGDQLVPIPEAVKQQWGAGGWKVAPVPPRSVLSSVCPKEYFLPKSAPLFFVFVFAASARHARVRSRHARVRCACVLRPR
eukprot:2462036-Rhodomonas_salina.1